MRRSLLILLLVTAGACMSPAQIVLQKAVISNAGGTTSDATTRLQYTVGETAVGVASNSTTIGRFGFWNASSLLASVRGSGAGSIKQIAVHPNPASNEITIDFDLAKAGDLDVRLYTTTGDLISTLYSGKKAAGQSTIRADIAHLATGTYFIAALVPGGLLQSRLTVIR